MAETPKPVAQGDLRKSPLVHVIASLYRRTAAGTLVVWPESGAGGQDRVRFEAGLPVAVRTREPAGSIEAALERLADRAGGAYALFAEDLVGTPSATGEVDPAHLIRRLVHATRRTDGRDRVLSSRGAAPLRVKRGLTPKALGLDHEETEVLEVLRAAPASAPELIQKSGRPEVAKRLVYFLELLGALEEMDGRRAEITGSFTVQRGEEEPARPKQAPPAPRPRPRSTPPEPTFPEPPEGIGEEDRARWDDLVARARTEDEQTHYELLGVSPDASTQEIEQAYVRFAKITHPDRLGPALGPLRPHADKLFRRATEARGALVEADRRAEYDARVREGGGSPAAERHVREVVEAALEYQRVDLLLRKRAYDEALRVIDRNLELSPDIADYPAKRAYALMLAHGVDDVGARKEIQKLLDRALELDPSHEGANFTKGQLFKKLGEPGRALAHFRAVVEANPHNIDAAREVRLASLKKGKKEASSEGLFGKLLKKKR